MESADHRPLALLTGASSGIGCELAVQFAQHDFDVVIAAEDPGITMAAQRIGSAAHPVQADLATDAGVRDLCTVPRGSGRILFTSSIAARAGLQGTKLYETDKDDPADAARDGYEALMAGKDHVVAGSAKNKPHSTGSRVMSEPAKAKMHGSLAEPGGGSGQ